MTAVFVAPTAAKRQNWEGRLRAIPTTLDPDLAFQGGSARDANRPLTQPNMAGRSVPRCRVHSPSGAAPRSSSLAWRSRRRPAGCSRSPGSSRSPPASPSPPPSARPSWPPTLNHGGAGCSPVRSPGCWPALTDESSSLRWDVDARAARRCSRAGCSRWRARAARASPRSWSPRCSPTSCSSSRRRSRSPTRSTTCTTGGWLPLYGLDPYTHLPIAAAADPAFPLAPGTTSRARTGRCSRWRPSCSRRSASRSPTGC